MSTLFAKKTYHISLPASTSPEVAEWFNKLDMKHQLSEVLIQLVYLQISSGNVKMTIDAEPSLIEKNIPLMNINQSKLIDKLHNWEESNIAIFRD